MEIITTYIRLKDYALWYYFRYYPSNGRLHSKLLEKTLKNTDLVEEVYNEIVHLFNEREVLVAKIDNYIFRNKNLNYIRNNLYKKEFKKDDIESILQEKYIQDGESLLSENFLMRKIENYRLKGKSENYIKQKLIERKEDKALVESIIGSIFGELGEKNNLKSEYEKLQGKYERQKIIEKLLRKGFHYGDIKDILS